MSVTSKLVKGFVVSCFCVISGYSKVPVPTQGCYLSAFTEDGIESFETLVQKKQAIAMFYTNWESNFPLDLCKKYALNGNIPHLSWEPYRVGGTENDPSGVNENSNANIIAGNKDAYIRKYAQDCKSFGKPIFIRFGLEMNGDWYEWGGAWSGKDSKTGYGDPLKYDGAERFVDAWKHIHDIFSKEGATNVSWVFAPNVSDEPSAAWNKMELYYPGESYVDWLAIDGYNWGGSNWQSFEDVFKVGLPRIEALGKQPIMIAEFASSTVGGNKAQWITSTFASIKAKYPRIKAVTWFSIIKEEPWGVNTTPEDLASYQKAISDPYFLDKIASETVSMATPILTKQASFTCVQTNKTIAITPSITGAYEIFLYTLQGKSVFQTSRRIGTSFLNVNSLAGGTYLLTVKSDVSSKTTRIALR